MQGSEFTEAKGKVVVRSLQEGQNAARVCVCVLCVCVCVCVYACLEQPAHLGVVKDEAVSRAVHWLESFQICRLLLLLLLLLLGLIIAHVSITESLWRTVHRHANTSTNTHTHTHTQNKRQEKLKCVRVVGQQDAASPHALPRP